VNVVGDGIPVARRRCGNTLSFQKLDAYTSWIELVAVSAATGEAVPRGYSDLREQLVRAAISVQLNIAEEAVRASEADGTIRDRTWVRDRMRGVIDVVRVLGAMEG
jgi:hypothetical protein